MRLVEPVQLMKSNPKIFGTDGVRGTANVEPVTAETALKLGRAAGHVFKKLESRSVRKFERTESIDIVSIARGVDVFGAKAKLGVSYR